MSTSSKNNSRFSTLKVFKFKANGGGDTAKPPPLPPKDPLYNRSLYNRSLASLSPESFSSVPPTPVTPECVPRTSPVPSQTSSSLRSFEPSLSPPLPPPSAEGSVESGASSSTTDPRLKPKKSIFKFSSLAKRANRSVKNLLADDNTEQEPTEGDEGITRPWNFQHNVHVDEGYVGLPPSWSSALSEAGFDDEEIAAIHARRMAARTSNGGSEPRYLYTDRPASPASVSSSQLTNPVPRSTSLLRSPNPNPNFNSALLRASATSTLLHSNSNGSSYAPSSAAPSPIAPSFNSRSISSGRPRKLSASSRQYSYTSEQDSGGSDAQYVFVNGNGQAETIIEPYPLDAASTTSHRINQSQSESGHLSVASHNVSRVPSPLVHSTSLPIPVPPTVLPNPHPTPPATAPPRTPPRRILHVANASDDSPEQGSPPPAYVSPLHSGPSSFPREKWRPTGDDRAATPLPLPAPSRPPPPTPDKDDLSREDEYDDQGQDDSLYAASPDPSLINRHLSPTPPLVIDKRVNRLTALPPRISFHQDADLEDWTESLFSAISDEPEAGPSSGQSAGPSMTKAQARTTLKPGMRSTSARLPSPLSLSPPSTSYSCPPSASASSPPSLPDVSFGANISLGAHVRQGKGSERPVLPDVSLGANVSSLGANLNAPSNPTTPTGATLDVPVTDELIALAGLSPGASSPLTPALSEGKSPTAWGGTSPAARSPTVAGSSGIQLNLPENSPTDYQHSTSLSPPPSRPSSSSLLPSASTRPAGDRDSGMSTMTVTAATIVSGAVVKRAVASVVDSQRVSMMLDAAAAEKGVPGDESQSVTDDGEVSVLDGASIDEGTRGSPSGGIPVVETRWPSPPPPPELPPPDVDQTPRPPTRIRTTSMKRGALGSPQSSHFSSETSSSADSAPLNTPKPSLSKVSLAPPSPLKDKSFAPEVSMLVSMSDTFGGVDEDEEEAGGERVHQVTSESIVYPAVQIVKSGSHAQRYPVWVTEAVAPLAEFIEDVDPQEQFADLQEIAEGESGSVYAARVVCPPTAIGLPAGTSHVAIKSIPVPPSSSSPGSVKIQDLAHEMRLLKEVRHEHVLTMDAIYVDLVDDSVWIRMEHMERSLADVIGLVSEGLSLQERMIARFASDVLMALEYLQKQHIAHRDVRSDNLLLNANGIVKLADFSNAIRVSRNAPMCTGVVGVIYWQAPEMRAGSYNALKVDVWSLGATVWELAQTEPPFADVQDSRQIGSQWPPLRHPELYSKGFHEFLKLCSRPSSSRPNPNELLNTPFIRNACGRPVNIQLLSQCRAIEEHVMQRESAADS